MRFRRCFRSPDFDFGQGAFTGAYCWLEVAVRTNDGGVFTKLSPRQPLLPAPYAVFANSASNLIGTLPVAQLGGTVPLQQLPAEVLTNNAPTVTLSGTFNGIFNAAGGNTVTTNTVKTAFKVVSPTPPPDGDTNWFGPWTPGTRTARIQEALNSIMPTNDDPLHFYGGEIFIRPGLCLLTQTVQTPVSNVNGTPKANVFLTLVGAGEKASVLCYSNSIAGTVLVLGGGRIGGFNPFNALNFTVRNLGFTSFINGHTDLVYVNGNNGGVFRGSIEDCWFASWYSFTNNDAWSGPPADLVPINAQLNYGGDTFTIARCHFTTSMRFIGPRTTGRCWTIFSPTPGYRPHGPRPLLSRCRRRSFAESQAPVCRMDKNPGCSSATILRGVTATSAWSA